MLKCFVFFALQWRQKTIYLLNYCICLSYFDNFNFDFCIAALPDLHASPPCYFSAHEKAEQNKKPFFRSVSFTGIKIENQLSFDFTDLAVVKETSVPLTHTPRVAPPSCSVRPKLNKSLEMAGTQRVAALDLPEPTMLAWELHHDGKQYLVFGKLLQGVYHYVTYRDSDNTFWYKNDFPEPHLIDLSQEITDPRVFSLQYKNRLVVVCSNGLNASYNATTNNVDATGEAAEWSIDIYHRWQKIATCKALHY